MGDSCDAGVVVARVEEPGLVERDHFELGREVSKDGRFVRQQSAFRRWVTADGSSGFPAEAGRYHLYVCLCCPWSHRTAIGRLLKGLEGAISISYVDPYRDALGWAFTGGDFVDEVNGFALLSEAYHATDPSFDDRITVPVLWDRETGQIVSNESGELLRMLGLAFDAFAESDADLYPSAHRLEIDALNELIYENVNNAVYQAGFSSSQEAYEEACARVFAVLDRLEERLGETRYLVADATDRSRLAVIPHPRALRLRVLRALQVQSPSAGRLPEPLGVYA